jgi:hypothetical protein
VVAEHEFLGEISGWDFRKILGIEGLPKKSEHHYGIIMESTRNLR